MKTNKLAQLFAVWLALSVGAFAQTSTGGTTGGASTGTSTTGTTTGTGTSGTGTTGTTGTGTGTTGTGTSGVDTTGTGTTGTGTTGVGTTGTGTGVTGTGTAGAGTTGTGTGATVASTGTTTVVSQPHVINSSARVSLANNQIGILGFIIAPSSSNTSGMSTGSAGSTTSTGTLPNGYRRVLVRASSAALANYGISGTPADPQLWVYDSNLNVIATNDNWGTAMSASSSGSGGTSGTSSSATAIAAGMGYDEGLSADAMTSAASSAGAFPLSSGSTDASVVLDLPPGAYTVVVMQSSAASGASSTTSTNSGNDFQALIEMYTLE